MKTKEINALLDAMNKKSEEVRNLVAENKIDEAKAAKNELAQMKDKLDILRDLDDADEQPADATPVPAGEPKVDAVKDFADKARAHFKNVAQESVGADGGYVVPADIQTMVNKRKEALFDLSKLVATESVTTNAGRRTYQTKKAHTGFKLVGEGGKIGAVDGPKFDVVNFTIGKYAGYLPVTNELLEDSDENITATIVDWLAAEDVATRNALIIKLIGGKAATDLKNLNGIKTAINKTLGSAYAGLVKIVTNDDGLNYLDTLTDSQGRYLLNPNVNPAEPWDSTLTVGTHKVPVLVVPSEVMANGEAGKVPFAIGDIYDAFKIFDRKKLTIATSDQATVGEFSAFENDMTIFRAIDRLDAQVTDENAFVNGYITVA